MRYFEDFEIGEVIELGQVSVTAEEIIAFAQQFDPQPFHLDDEAARKTHFGGLVASGWHTCSLMMRQVCLNLLPECVSHGSPGMDEIRWLKPLRPGDVMHVRFSILDKVASRSKPDRGVLFTLFEGLDEQGEPIATMRGRGMYGRRPGN